MMGMSTYGEDHDAPDPCTTFEELYLERDPETGVFVVVDQTGRVSESGMTVAGDFTADIRVQARGLFPPRRGPLPPVRWERGAPTRPTERTRDWWEHARDDDGGPLVWLLLAGVAGCWLALWRML